MDRAGAESLSSHTLPVPPEQTFSMSDHAATQHYHAVEALSSNVLPSASRDRIAPPEPQAKPPSTKRRKINTCFPCKQRKVKCDRQHPYCGQCQKHRIPAERCVWSSDMALAPDVHSAATSALSSYSKPDASHAPISLGTSDWGSSQGTELALDSDTRAVIERISHLEQRLATNTATQPTSHDLPTTSAGQTQIDPILLAGTGLSLGDVNADRSAATSLSQDAAVAAELAFWRSKMEQHHRPAPSSDTAQMTQMQAEQNIAADALAMFARHSQQSSLAGGDQTMGRPSTVASTGSADAMPRQSIVNALFDNATFAMNNSTVRIRAALELLPDTQQIDYLIKILQTVDLHISYGLSWRLIKTQLTALRTQLAGWNRMHTSIPEQLDLSFVALLLVLLGVAAQFTEPRFFIEQGLCTSPEQIETYVDSWVDAAQSVLAIDDFVTRTNWNHLAALLLYVDHHAIRGRLPTALVAMATLLRLAEQQGYHTLGCATDDEQAWRDSPSSKLVRVSPVCSTVRPGTWVRPSGTSTSLPDRSHLVREAARRLWFKIMCKDMALGTVVHRAIQLDPRFVTTKAPLNVDEDDLPDGETHVLSSIKDSGRPTINSLMPFAYQIADLGRQWSVLVHSRMLTYAHILDLDTKFRALLSSLPIFLRPDPTLEQLPEVRQEQAQRPYLAMHRLIVFEAVNQRLLVLHRDDMCRGHHDEKFAYSTRVAVDAARTILSCRQQIDNVHPAVQKHAAFRHHLFQAAIVLSIHLLELSHKAQGESQVAHQLRDDIALIMNYLYGSNNLRTSLPVPQKIALKLIEMLLAEAHERQNRDADKSMSGNTATAGAATAPSAALSTIGMDADSSNHLFQLAPAPASTPDPVTEAATAFSIQMLHPDFANKNGISEFFASLDELMVPIY